MAVYAVIFIVVSMCVSAYMYLNNVYNYWTDRKVAGPKPSFPFGNTKGVAMKKTSFNDILHEAYKTYPDEKLIGLYDGRTPVLVVKDIELVKAVLIKDFVYFRNRSPLVIDHPIAENLFHAVDERWRLLRQKLTPIFSSGKLRNMFPLIEECVVQFQDYLDHLVTNNTEPEMRNLMEKFTLQLFTSCVLGIKVPTLSDDDNYFHKIGRMIFELSPEVLLAITIDSVFPGIVRKLRWKVYNKEVTDFFRHLVRDGVNQRCGKPKIRKDFMDLLIDLKEQGQLAGEGFNKDSSVTMDITEELIAAQALVFYAAGFNGSSASTSFLLHELALNQEIQNKIKDEISRVVSKYGGLTYDAIQDMKYLDMAYTETLRKYTLGGSLTRESTKEYTFPGTNVTIGKGIKIIIPTNSIHLDPQYYSDPDKFDPDRFLPQNQSMIVNCSYLPFGEGPRICIGMRFAKIQSMVSVASLLLKYKVVPSARTEHKLVFDNNVTTLESASGIWMKIVRREDVD